MSRENWTSEKIFDRLLTNKTQKTYWDNIRVLRSRPNTEVYNRAYELSKSSIEKEKIIGIYVLAQLGFNPRFNREKTINLYFNILNNQQSPKVLEAILSSIAHNNEALTNQQILELIKFRNHNYSDVRFHLTLALSAVEKEEAIDTLIYLTRDKHSDVRNYATWSLGSQLININSEKIINALWE